MMKKVVIFDSGWGGEEVADYVEEELSVVDVIRVIDWRNAPYAGKTKKEVTRLTEEVLRPYLGRVDVIVIASFAATLILGRLQKKYPQQRFLGFEMDFRALKKEWGKRYLWLGDSWVREAYMEEMDAIFQGRELLMPKCDHWTGMIDEGTMNVEVLRQELGEFTGVEIDGIIVSNTHFWDLKPDLEKLFGRRVQFLDQKEQFFRDLNVALEFDRMYYRACPVQGMLRVD